MATRPVFLSFSEYTYVKRIDTEFEFCPGFSMQQKKRSVSNLHNAWRRSKTEPILEVSRVSDSSIGRSLSAFNLPVILEDGRKSCVECLFQGSKCFEKGGPYHDLYYGSPFDAKKDMRLRESGRLTAFVTAEEKFPLDPQTYFYDWIYVNALAQNKELHKEILSYNAFTDIMFNPQKQINCQAEAVAIFAGLMRSGRLEYAIRDRHSFLKEVFGV